MKKTLFAITLIASILSSSAVGDYGGKAPLVSKNVQYSFDLITNAYGDDSWTNDFEYIKPSWGQVIGISIETNQFSQSAYTWMASKADSAAMSSALAGKMANPSGTTNQFIRGDGSLANIPLTTNGINGAQGPQGIQGATGATGAAGPTGATGSTGAAGANGLNGTNPIITIASVTTGAAGSSATVSNVVSGGVSNAISFTIPRGDTGATGAQGPAGTNGTNGISITGAKGDKGDTGSQGIQGIQGFSGANGSNGTNGLNGTNGTNGLNGAAGATGPTGPQGTNAFSVNVTNRPPHISGLWYSNDSPNTLILKTKVQATFGLVLGTVEVHSWTSPSIIDVVNRRTNDWWADGTLVSLTAPQPKKFSLSVEVPPHWCFVAATNAVLTGIGNSTAVSDANTPFYYIY